MTQKAGQEFTTLADKVKRVGDRLSALGQTAIANGVLMAGALQRPIGAFMDLETASTELASALMKAGGVVGPEFEKLNRLAIELGNTLPGTTADFQALMTMLMRQGISANAVLNGMGEAAAFLSVQLKMPTAAAAEFVANLQDATRTAETDMLGMVDTIQRMFNLGVDPGNMLAAFTALGPAMDTIRLTGLDGVNALAPLVVLLDQAGQKGSTAGIALEKIFRLGFDAKKMGDANAALKEFGVSLNFLNEQGEFAGLDNFLNQLDKLKNIPTAARIAALTEAFGQDAQTLQALTPLIDRGTAAYGQMSARMREQASINERIGAQLGTLRNLWEAFTGTVTNALAAIGATWGPELKRLTGWLNDLAVAFQKIGAGPSEFDRSFAAMKGLNNELSKLEANKERLKTWVGVVGGLTLATVAFGLLAKAIGLATTALSFLMAHPVVAAITAIAVATMLVYLNWDKVKKFIAELPAWLQGKMNELVFIVKSVASAMYAAGANLISQLWEGMKAKYAAMKAWLSSALSDVGSWLIGRSPPPAGPLAKIDIGGANLMAAWLRGMQSVPVRSGIRQIAGRAAGGFGGGGSGMMTITFAPQITVAGGGDTRRQVTEALHTSYAEFQRLMSRYEADRARRSYATA